MEQEKKLIKWVHPVYGEKIVEEGSPEHQELMDQLDKTGLCVAGDPRYPNAIPFEEYMKLQGK